MDKKRAIVSFANGRGNYLLGLDRLEQSIARHGGDAAFFGFRGEELVGAPPHLENPYAFKIYCWQKVISLGYRKILWLDASVAAVAPLDPVWELVEKDGYIMQEAGNSIGRWCNESTLAYFGMSREEAMGLYMYGNAGLLGLNLNFPICREFFDKWRWSMLDGCFIGSWDDHRHDMTCGSIIANRLKMKYQKGDLFLHYAPIEQPPAKGVCLHASGL